MNFPTPFVAFALGLLVYYFFNNREQAKLTNPDPESLIIPPDVDIEAVRDRSGKITLRWTANLGTVRIFAGTQPDDIATDTPIARTDAQEIVIDSLDASVRHFFLLDTSQAQFVVAERVMPLEGAVNFRDLGGYVTGDGKRVRWGRVYRAGGLATLSDADVTLLNHAGLRLICDLRTEDEATKEPDRVPESIQYKHMPIKNETRTSSLQQAWAVLTMNNARLTGYMHDAYTRVTIDENAALIGQVLREIADDKNLPMVIHCSAGKDRTGIISAIVLSLLGVPDETILADYSLSNHYYDNFRQFAERNIGQMRRFGITGDRLYPLLIADVDTLQLALRHIRKRYGSIESYVLTAAGIDEDVLTALRNNLLSS
ncbi:MAG: tyrosine-protein phosphatase [Aggregatilineales bacterium]